MRKSIAYRRSPNLVAHWQSDGLVFRNFATGCGVIGNALAIGLLDYFSTWKPAGPLIAQSSLSAANIEAALDELHRASILQRSDRTLRPAERKMDQWQTWNPAAGFFHFSTKNARYTTKDVADRLLIERAASRPSPPPLKVHEGHRRIALPRGPRAGQLETTLRQRRTWRRFSNRPLPRSMLAALLSLTFRVQHWVDLGVAGIAMLRTSPSAGARHPLEAYIVARRVAGLRPSIYHYAPADHHLIQVRPNHRALDTYLPGQPWYREAAALILITAVFERTEWKYPFARAYRTILLEAGHFAQTFLLVATALKLAPFCTAALADSLIERDLGIDGVTESVIYACGVGMRPPGVDWAPWPDTTEVPRLFPPKSASRRKRAR